MSNDDLIRDAYGIIDDFRAPAGKVGTSLSRKLFLQGSIPQSLNDYLKKLSDNGYAKNEVCSVLIHAVNMAYGDGAIIETESDPLDVGDLVKTRPEYTHLRESENTPGIITSHVIKIEHSYEVAYGNEDPSTWQSHTIELVNG